MTRTAIGVIGGGAWGTALATSLAHAGHRVKLWAREAEVVAAINQGHQNPLFLPKIPLDPGLTASGNLAEVAAAELLLLVSPAQHLRQILGQLAPDLDPRTPLVLCSKGIEQHSGKLMTEVAAEVLPDQPLAVLSGPTFAAEVARGLPAALCLAAASIPAAEAIAAKLGHLGLRLYPSDDLIGAEVGGAVKNVLAIACGIVVGRALGENARAALITRGMAEILRFGAAKGARPETLMGLAGMGDLILTCSSLQSRNMSLGAELGRGRNYQDIIAERNSVAEGAFTAPILSRLARDYQVEMPITEAVNAILYQGLGIDVAIEQLLSRPMKREFV